MHGWLRAARNTVLLAIAAASQSSPCGRGNVNALTAGRNHPRWRGRLRVAVHASRLRLRRSKILLQHAQLAASCARACSTDSGVGMVCRWPDSIKTRRIEAAAIMSTAGLAAEAADSAVALQRASGQRPAPVRTRGGPYTTPTQSPVDPMQASHFATRRRPALR